MLNLSNFHSYQKDIVDHIINTPRCGVFAAMGTGKTVSTLTALDRLALVEEVYPALILAPKRVVQSVWPQEPQNWEHLQHINITPILGDPRERREALHAPADIYAINYDNLLWLGEELKNNWPFKSLVADESTRLKGFRTRQGTKRSKVIGRIAHKVFNRFIQLTGTPSPNGLKDLWATGWFIDGGVRLGRSFSAFENRWFRRSFNGFQIEPLPHAEMEIKTLLSDVCLSVKFPGQKEPIVRTIEVELPPKAMRHYKEMEKELFTELEGEGVVAFNAAARTQKCLQIANGAAYVSRETREWKQVHDVKLEALEEIIEEAGGMPVLVAYNFKSDLERLRKRFKQGRVLDQNPQTVTDWNAGRIPVLFAHPASCGHGLNLQHGGNILVFFGINWNLEEHLQIIERIGPTRQKQSGYDRPVFIYYILAKNTVDNLVWQRLHKKREVQDILLEALRKKTS